MTYTPNRFLSRLVGHRLYSVRFVFDYVELDFDHEDTSHNPGLTCDVLPHVLSGGRWTAPADPAWAGALRSLIPRQVTATHEATGTGLRLDFGDDAIRLHPSPEELEGPEIAMLSGFGDGDWMVWRPGEDSFEDL